MEEMPPDICAGKIFEISGEKLAPEIAADLWPKILQHKWLLSEKLHRDVGLRTACIDYIDNMEQAHKEFMAYQRKDILAEMGAQTISREVWDTISDSQPPKKLVQQKIILPLIEKGLSTKHGVVPPKTIIFFGPPVRENRLRQGHSRNFVLVVHRNRTSMLMADGVEKIGANLRSMMEKSQTLMVPIFL